MNGHSGGRKRTVTQRGGRGGSLRRVSLLLLGALLAALMVAGCGGGGEDSSSAAETVSTGGEETKEKITVAAAPGTLLDFLPEYGQTVGTFAENGLDARFVATKSGPDAAAILASGSADFGDVNPSVGWPILAEGGNFKYLLNSYESDAQVIAQPDEDLPNAGKKYPAPVKDFKGKKIGVTALGSQQDLAIQAMLADAGMSPDEVTLVAVGINGPAAFKAGQIDLLVTFAPLEVMIGEGNYQVLVDRQSYQELSPELLYTDWVVSGKVSPQTAGKFCEAMHATLDHARDPGNRSTLIEYLTNLLDVSTQEAEQIWDEFGPLFNVDPISEKQWQSNAESPLIEAEAPPYAQAVIPNPC